MCHNSQSMTTHLPLPLLIRKVFWAARRVREIWAPIPDHPYTINNCTHPKFMCEMSPEFHINKQTKKILKSGFSSADTFLHPLKTTFYLDSAGLPWQIPPLLSLLQRYLGACLSQLKACQTAQFSTKTCSTRPEWSNLSAASIIPLVTIFPLTYPLQVTLKATSSTAEHSNTASDNCFSPKTFQDPLPSKLHRFLLLGPHWN